ncbi:unnamed protein product [Phytophthora fragariaefolia]|uniref:Unnamed protein product n=1 Tax=Phytophthora fragariaefolia TaxID=1490495 RepID=A0A9W7CIN0_9STRA|nr:unnamed protein product [Phytophthora fragariaefolia]
MRSERIIQAQGEEKWWIANLRPYRQGAVTDLSAEEAKSCAKIASDYDLDESGLLLYFPQGARSGEDRDSMVRLVVPEPLQQDGLHHYHVSLEAGHQGIGRTYQRVRRISTGAVCSGVFRELWVNAWIVKLGKGAP